MLKSWDERRDYIVLPTLEEALRFSAEHFAHTAERAIQQRGKFFVALSGGSTPKAIFPLLKKQHIDWSKVYLFWSDERAVPPDHSDSNYHMAMTHGLGSLVPLSQIFRLKGEIDLEKSAREYEELIRRHLDKHFFDLVMLGCGEDGHTASLFPNTPGLQETTRLVIPNRGRLSFTYPLINSSRLATIYALGPAKAKIVPQVLNAAIDSPFPASRVGTPEHKALWILDKDASSLLS